MLNMFSSKQSKQIDKVESTGLESVLDAMLDFLDGSEVHISEDELGSKEAFEKWTGIVEKLKLDKRKQTLAVNSLLQDITRMDSMRDMIKSVDVQTTSLQSMVANSEELSASIEDVSSIVQDVAVHTNETRKNTESGVLNMQKSIDFVIESFEEMNAVNRDMGSVSQKTHDISQIIDIVRGIADQTNLLALNAAIEAARAGEHGRGFAVVADEVRKLAEHTKESVDQVQKNIVDLQQAIDSSVKKMEATSTGLDSGRELVESTLVTIKEIELSIQEIDGTVGQVASNTEEQSAVTESFAEHMDNIASEAEGMSSNAKETGHEIYQSSKNLDSIRMDMISNRVFLEDADMIDIYKTDHMIWRWKVYNMLLGYESVDINAVGDYKGCRLGKWYYGIDCKNLEKVSCFRDMESPHQELHRVAREAVEAYNRGDIQSAEEGLKKMDECSRKVFACLEQVKREMKNKNSSPI